MDGEIVKMALQIRSYFAAEALPDATQESQNPVLQLLQVITDLKSTVLDLQKRIEDLETTKRIGKEFLFIILTD